MSKNRSFRPRSKLSFDEEDDDGDAKPAVPAAPAAAAPKPKPIAKTDSKPSLLSFGEDAEEEEAVGLSKKKKDKGKGKLGRGLNLPELPVVSSLSTQRTGAGEYSKEGLRELAKNAMSLSTAKFAKEILTAAPEPAAAPAAPAGEGIIKLSGSFKPAGQSKDERFSIIPNALVKPKPDAAADDAAVQGRVGSAAPGAGGRGSSRPTPSPPPGQQGAAAAGGKPGAEEEEEEDGDDGPIIPDEETIRLAKAKRERLRQAHLAPDYVPLGGTAKLLARAGAGAAGRGGPEQEMLGQPGEGSGSDAEADLEEHMRIKFTVKGTGKAEQRKGYAKTVQGPEDEEDGEESFANEQLRKAVRRQRAQMAAAAAGGAAAAGAVGMQAGYPAGYGAGGYDASAGAALQGYASTGMADASGAAYGMAAGAGAAAGMAGHHGISAAAAARRTEAVRALGSAAVNSLQEGLKRLSTAHKNAQSNLARTTNNLSSSLQKVEVLERDIKAASEKYVEMQQIRAYIADLCDCLADKSALVEELEEALGDLREERAGAAKEAAQALESEMLSVAEAAVGAAMGVLGRGGSPAAAKEAAESAAAAAEDDLLEAAEGPEEVDEFGRSMNLGRRREAQERRRQRRLALEKEAQRVAAVAAGAGVSVDEEEWDALEEPAQASRYEGRHKEVMDAAGTVFADAGEEFASLKAVKAHLEGFKLRYPKDYGNCYMHLSTPALFAPYVRLELLRWDPFYADSTPGRPNGSSSEGAANGGATGGGREGVHRGFDQQAWYETLFDYGLGPDPAAAAAALQGGDDPDTELVPQLVRKLVLPVAQHMLERCWDPTSLRQSAAAAAVLGDLCVYVPAEEERMAEVLGGVVGKLEAAAEKLVLPPWPHGVLQAAPVAQAVLSRRFRAAVRLLGAVCAFEGLLSRGLLLPLALGRVVNKSCMPALRAAVAGVGQASQQGSPTAAAAVAVGRVEAVVQSLPQEWFEGGAPSEASQLTDLAVGLGRTLEAEAQGPGRGELASLAARLGRSLARLGEAGLAGKLAAVYGVAL